MWNYLLRRALTMVLTVWVISILVFIVIQLPPGDFASNMVSRMTAQTGAGADPAVIQQMRRMYGIDQPLPVQYLRWIQNVLTRGRFGYSMLYNRDAIDIIRERLPMTLALSFSSFMLIWMISLPAGIYSAVKKYTLGDYVVSFFGFVGLATPNFLLALLFLFLAYRYFGVAAFGLFSEQYIDAPWSFAKLLDLVSRMVVPVIVIGTAGTAGLIRTVRANLLDELEKPYVDTARAKGLKENKLLWKYPVRHSLNPFISTLGWALPGLISGEVIVSIVLNLPTAGPILFHALANQDMYLAAGFLLVLSALTVVGTFISDILLAFIDPRIRFH